MLLINRDSVIFFCNFYMRISKYLSYAKNCCMFPCGRGHRSLAAYAARLFLISNLACRPNGRKR